MIELAFPIATVVFLYLIAVPTLTLASSLLLRAWRARINHAHEMGSSVVWLLLVAPVLLPTIWLLVALAHNLDGHHGLASCLAPHDVTTFCIDLVVAAVLVIVPFKLGAFGQWRRERKPRCASLERRNVEGVDVWAGRGVPGLACTRGLFRPRIEIDAQLFDRLEAAQLRTVVLHELAHARAFDPLRKWTARVCMSVNPLSGLLRADLARWELGREILSDLHAVRLGADRFALAEALVRVARERPRPCTSCCGLLEMDTLEVRVRILCDATLPSPRVEFLPIVAGIGVAVFVTPHHQAHLFLDWLHHSAESGWLTVVGG